MNHSVKRKILSGLSIFLGMLCFWCLFSWSSVYGAEQRKVKVAFFPMDGYHITKEDGSYSGMDVEYLETLCEYVDWDVEYVPCTSWEEALQLLSDQKVDLVGSAQYSSERAEKFQYADLASGYTFGVIATNPDSTIAYEDFTAMRDITFGMVSGYVRKNEFLQYLDGKGIENPKIMEYATTAELQNALDAGEIDALVHTFTEVKEGQRLIGRFAPRPFYYITYQGNDELMRELNQGIADLKMNRPALEAELMSEFYYDKFDKAALLTTEEKEYITEKSSIVVGYIDGFYPFSYEENGEFKGLSRELLESGIHVTGLSMKYQKMDSRQAAREALQSGAIDVLAYCTDTDDMLEQCQLEKVKEYAEIPLVLVMEKSRTVSEIQTLATVDYLSKEAGNAMDLEGVDLEICNTQQECIAAVKDGKADAVLCDGYLAEHLLRTEMGYGNIQVKNVLSG